MPMSWHRLGILVGFGLAVAALATTSLAHESRNTTELPNDPMAARANMMRGAGVSEDSHSAMREFMQSDRAPQAMAKMMEMARRMGNGDVMLGMTRMMEMMGGGMMGGQGGMMMLPHQPGK